MPVVDRIFGNFYEDQDDLDGVTAAGDGPVTENALTLPPMFQNMLWLLEALPLAVSIWQQGDDRHLHLSYWNGAMDRLGLGSLAALRGRSVSAVFGRLPDLVHWLNLPSSSDSLPRHRLFVFPPLSGDRGPFTWSVQRLQVTDEVVLVLVEDITEQCQLETELRHRVIQQSAVATIAQQALTYQQLGHLLDEVARLLPQVVDVEYSQVWELLPNQSAFLLRSGTGWPSGVVGFATLTASADSHPGYTLLTQEPVIIEDLRIERRFRGSPLLHNQRVISGVSVLITTGDEVFGVLSIYSGQKRYYTEDQLHFLQSISYILGAAIQRHRQEERLTLLDRAINASGQGIVITDAIRPHNPIIYVNEGFSRITGYGSEEVKGLSCNLLQGTDRQQPALEELREAILEGRECRVELRNYRKDGTFFWNELSLSPVYSDDRLLTNFIGVQTDISARKEADEAIRKQEEQFRLIFELSPVGMAIGDLAGRYLQVNTSLCHTLGYSAHHLQRRTSLEMTHPEDRPLEENLTRQLREGKLDHFQLEKRYIAKNGAIISTITQVMMVRDKKGDPLHVLHQIIDISQRKRMEEQLIYDALHDSLTGLPNRSLLIDRLGQAIKRHQRHEKELFALLFLDLDRFKLVNDTLGHQTGDALLVQIAQRLEQYVRPSDTVARLGGDEFCLLLEDLDDQDQVIAIAARVKQQLSIPFEIQGQTIFNSVSIGIALATDGYEQPEDFLRDADLAMYRAKDQGRDRYEIFNQEMREELINRISLEHDLRHALDRQELRLVYQPIVDLVTGQISGFEALLRWVHPQRGFVSPADFITIAEETGLILPIGQWVLATACKQLCQWHQHYPHLQMNINLSGQQFREEALLAQVAETLDSTGVRRSQIKLELTESMLIEDVPQVKQILQGLRDLGVQLAIDDFGTGYSSLSYLHRFPVHTLKVDRSFVELLQGPEGEGAIVRAIVTLAHTLGMTVTAEGIETVTQWEQLRALECEHGQGYYFAKPLTAEQVGEFLADRPQWLPASPKTTETPRAKTKP